MRPCWKSGREGGREGGRERDLLSITMGHCCSILESAVEDIRRDVVERRCRVHEREVDGLVDAVQNTIQALSQARGILYVERGSGVTYSWCENGLANVKGRTQ